MSTFKEWWLRQFLPQEHRYSAEMSWMYCYALMERSCNTRIAEAISTQRELIEQLEKSAVLTQQNIMNYKATISIQQATIERLTEQLNVAAEENAKLVSDKYPFAHIRIDCSEYERDLAIRNKLIELGWTPPAEIEADNG